MNVFTDYSKPYIIESLASSIVPRHFWVFSGKMMDYKLSTISYIEETRGPTITLLVEANEIDLPASWYIMVGDEETSNIDTIQVSDCDKALYSAVLMSPDDNKIRLAPIRAISLKKDHPLVHPMLEKGTMMCYPLGPAIMERKKVDLCMCVGPHDLNSKYLSRATISDIIY